MTVQRFKHTSPPPKVCQHCWWQQKYKELKSLFKQQRREMIRMLASKGEPEQPDFDRGPDDEPDLLDLFEGK